jgi:hypothetical protein
MTAVRTIWGPAAIGVINAQSGALTGQALNDADNAVAWTFNIPFDGSITEVGFLITALAGTPPQYNAGIVTIDASGLPTTTAYGGSAVTGYTPTSTGWKWVTLSTPATANAGDWAAVRIYPTGTAPDVSNNITVLHNSPIKTQGTGMAYTTAWGSATLGSGTMAIKYSGGVIYGMALSSSTVHVQIRQNTTPDEVGDLFQLPAAMTCYGAKTALPTTFGISAVFDVVLYDASNNVLGSATIGDKDYIDDQGYVTVYWDAVNLSASTNYRLIIKPTVDANGDVYVQKWTLESAAALAALPEGSRWQYTSRVDAGSWDDTATTAVCPMGLLVSDITFSAGAAAYEYGYIG